MRTKTMELCGWGRRLRSRSRVARPENVSAVRLDGEPSVLARGLGRSYGDAAQLAGGLVVLTERLNRFLSFDSSTGLLRAEAGTRMAEVLETFVPRGWFPSVTPGTKFVTLGGCAAADVHGKNHHREGGFGSHVLELEVMLADGRRVPCSPASNADLFRATVGGMGLTGFITEVAFEMKPVETPYMIVRHTPARDLEECMALLEDAALDDEHTVTWLDATASGRSLGRGVLIRGQHAKALELPRELRERATTTRRARLTVPFDLPSWVMGRAAARLFNGAYFRRQGRRCAPFVSHFDDFFYPLDAVRDWNRAYGRRGLVQYQCVLPHGEAAGGVRRMLEALTAAGMPSFLAVLKRLGAEGPGLLSFPTPGYTLSLDFPAARERELLPLLRSFDELVTRLGGRVYLAKDSTAEAETVRAMYGVRLAEWKEIKARFDPENRFGSDLSRRLGLTP